ncbi:mechanosensitive ion channel family protein [Candidatus Zixiibacteriota bacterium]
MEQVVERLIEFATVYGIRVIGAIIILILGRIVAGMCRRLVRKLLTRTETDPSIVSFAGSLTYTLVIVFVIIAVLQKFGIQTASLVAVLGAATFAIGFALQGSLSNFAAGIMILMFRPYKIDDYIEAAGVAGSVKDIKLFTTILATPDNIKIIVPNSKIFGDVIKNITAYDTRRVSIEVGISYGADIQKAFDVIMGIVKAEDRVMDDPAPMIAVKGLADSSVTLVTRAWTSKEDFWDLTFDLNRKIKEALDASGIEIPFPQRVVHMASKDE